MQDSINNNPYKELKHIPEGYYAVGIKDKKYVFYLDKKWTPKRVAYIAKQISKGKTEGRMWFLAGILKQDEKEESPCQHS